MVKLTLKKPRVNTQKPTTWGFAVVFKTIHQLLKAGHGNSPDSSQGLSGRSSKRRPYLQKKTPRKVAFSILSHIIICVTELYNQQIGLTGN